MVRDSSKMGPEGKDALVGFGQGLLNWTGIRLGSVKFTTAKSTNIFQDATNVMLWLKICSYLYS